MDEATRKLKNIFDNSNGELLKRDIVLFNNGVSERTICGALSQILYEKLKNTEFPLYHVDVEYNRNKNRKIKTCIRNTNNVKTICILNNRQEPKIINITCDLIVHSRGEIRTQDNLIAVEMKKSTRSIIEKDSDRIRLMALTKDIFDDIWSFDGKTLPEHVCRYKLGVYYEINLKRNKIYLEYYYKGNKISEKMLKF